MLHSSLSSLSVLPDSSVHSLPPLTHKVADLRWQIVLHIATGARPLEVEEQNNQLVSGAIPGLVFDHVVKDQTLPFAPGTRLWSDAHTAPRWNDQSKMRTIDRPNPSDMRPDMSPRRKA